MVGGGELLRDEQIYLAHKCANPLKYAPPLEMLREKDRKFLEKYKPTDVQLQVWDDLCHVAPTLSFTRPAKFMYRSVAQFGAWALARAQKRGIEILGDDEISVISNSSSGTEAAQHDEKKKKRHQCELAEPGQVGKAGDPLPNFGRHMIRQRVTRHGKTLPLAAETELPGCCMDVSHVGVAKEGPVKRWLAEREKWDSRYSSAKQKVQKNIVSDMATGFQEFEAGEHPPPTALAGRRLIDSDKFEKKKRKSMGLSLWSLWGSKHDELTVEREKESSKNPEVQDVTGDEGRGARTYQDIESQQPSSTLPNTDRRGGSPRRTVVGEKPVGQTNPSQNTPVAELIEQRKQQEDAHPSLLGPDYVPETGVAGKRPFIDGIALPFSLKKDADTASMVTLNSAVMPHCDTCRTLGSSGSRMDLAGQPESDDEARAERMLGVGAKGPSTTRTFANADEIARFGEPASNCGTASARILSENEINAEKRERA
jgi:hypothetical protein